MLAVQIVLAMTAVRPTHAQPTEKVLEIRMERELGFGDMRPAYHVAMRPNGTLIYDGLAFAKHLGTWRAVVSPARYQAITRPVIVSAFPQLKTDKLQPFDTPRSTIAVKFGHKNSTIAENGDD